MNQGYHRLIYIKQVNHHLVDLVDRHATLRANCWNHNCMWSLLQPFIFHSQPSHLSHPVFISMFPDWPKELHPLVLKLTLSHRAPVFMPPSRALHAFVYSSTAADHSSHLTRPNTCLFSVSRHMPTLHGNYVYILLCAILLGRLSSRIAYT